MPKGPYLVVGLGRAGRAAADALVEAGRVRAWDHSRAPEVGAARDALLAAGVPVRLGGDGLDMLEGIRTVVKSPGIRPDTPVIAAARRRDLLVIDELELGWRLARSPIVAVTGTNGKSTVAALLVAALSAAGRRPVLAGNTFFGPPLSAVPRDEHRTIVAEVSSYQAEASPTFLPRAAVFTNLTREHVHWHGTVAAYAAAKRRVFVRGDETVGTASINVDDRFGRDLAAAVRARGGSALAYGRSADADYRVGSVRSELRGAVVEIDAPDRAVTLRTRLPGVHNALNVAAALALADGLGLERERTLEALEAAVAVPGRFEVVAANRSFDVVVDFAHTPDGVKQTLALARELATARGGRVIATLTSFGNNDRDTREQIGRAARRGTDLLVLCAVSLRGEPGLVALAALLAGARSASGGLVECVLDRRAAIERAIGHARRGDLVMLLGRGSYTRLAHDRHGRASHLDDREVAQSLLS